METEDSEVKTLENRNSRNHLNVFLHSRYQFAAH